MIISGSGPLNGHAHFLQWGVIQISAANLIVVVLMLLVFALAVILQLPHSDDDAASEVQPQEVPHVEG